MAKGQSFIGLTTYLEKCGQDEIKLTFSDVERILGFQLSNSAYLHRTYWSNSESHPIAFGWLNAGYLSQHVDMKGQTVEFVKRTHQRQQIQGEAEKAVVMFREKCATLTLDEAVRCIRTYFNETVKDLHGRYMSWRHCYNAFVVNRNSADEKMLDYLALHLAFYLASWGMYRGSSFLLQKDYKVHIPVVKILVDKKFDPLVEISAEGLTEDANLELLEEVSERIRRVYAAEQPSFEGVTNNATDTLVTKILLGTLGCVPAYDRYYVQAVKQYNISAGVYSKESVRDVAVYYLSHKYEFESLREELSTCGTRYPAMKLMDMCMWQLAFEADKRKES
ncbi:MAG: hypothetical protein K2H41_13830 [Acetatifactor sp.]|nr:hypothetical protein [Acetatifactor sp.]